MKETGLPCKPWEIKAFLDGRKTAVIRPVKTMKAEKIVYGRSEGMIDLYKLGKYHFPDLSGLNVSEVIKHGPYGTIGDLIFMKETWAIGIEQGEIVFKCDKMSLYPDGEKQYLPSNWNPLDKWRPSIHMPKSAARIWMEITDVRVKRVRELSEEEFQRSGVDWLDDYCYIDNGWRPTFHDPYSGGDPIFKDGFQHLWQSDYGTWDQNPYVWIYDLKRVER